MDQRTSDQLTKVLALADSSHDGEAVMAVRKARELLLKKGLSFGDLAAAVASASGRAALPFSFLSTQQSQLEGQITQLRMTLNKLQAEIGVQNAHIDFWRRRATELEKALHVSNSEAQKWRKLAQETVDKLWDIGQEIHKEGEMTLSPQPSGTSPTPLERHAKARS